MLWLESYLKLCQISSEEYLNVLGECGFFPKTILQYHSSSLVSVLSQGIVKIIHPQLGKILGVNYEYANREYNISGISSPKVHSLLYKKGFCIIYSEKIEFNAFADRGSTEHADTLFFKLYNQLCQNKSNSYGAISVKFNEKLTSPRSYISFWDQQFQYYLRKQNFDQRANNEIEILYTKFKSGLIQPIDFILSHSDISPKHIYDINGTLGCIDIEESMYLDSTFMPALWIVRTINIRNRNELELYRRKFIINDSNWLWFKYHIFRELFIQQSISHDIKHFIEILSKLGLVT